MSLLYSSEAGENAMFVVFRKPVVPKGTFAAFETFSAANQHAERVVSEDRAEVYEVSIEANVSPAKRAPAAVAAVKMNEGTLIRAVVPKASAAEIERAKPPPSYEEVFGVPWDDKDD